MAENSTDIDTLEEDTRRPIKSSEPAKQDAYPMPSGPAITYGREILTAATNKPTAQGDTTQRLLNMAAGKRAYNHTQEITIKQNGKSRQVTYKTKKADVTFTIDNIDQLKGQSEPFYDFLLMKAQEHFYSGELTSYEISFNLQELIDIGMYSDIKSARRGATTHIANIEQLKLKGEISKIKEKEGIQITKGDYRNRQLFSDDGILNNTFFVEMNPNIDWAAIFQYFTILPLFAFSLKTTAHNLTSLIFDLARQNCKQLKKDGYFNISLRTVQRRLQLPSEYRDIIREGKTIIKKPTKDAKRIILEPIDAAIEEIEEAHRKTYNNTDLAIAPKIKQVDGTEEDLDITDTAKYSTATILSEGYLEITLKGELAKKYIYISELTAKEIKEYYKKQERIEEKAAAIKKAKEG